jgi:hypothetical protein
MFLLWYRKQEVRRARAEEVKGGFPRYPDAREEPASWLTVLRSSYNSGASCAGYRKAAQQCKKRQGSGSVWKLGLFFECAGLRVGFSFGASLFANSSPFFAHDATVCGPFLLLHGSGASVLLGFALTHIFLVVRYTVLVLVAVILQIIILFLLLRIGLNVLVLLDLGRGA